MLRPIGPTSCSSARSVPCLSSRSGGLQKHSEIKHDTEIEVEVESDIDMGTEIQTMEFIITT